MKKFPCLLAVVLLFAGLLAACGSGSGSGDPAASGITAAGSTAETTGSSGAWTINMAGGSGAYGGQGGYWYTDTYGVQGVRLLKAGTAATSFAMPTYNPPVDLGANACTASASDTVEVDDAGSADPGAGVLYMVTGNNYLYKGIGSGTVPNAAAICTGLKVLPGVTLTLGLNNNTGGTAAEDAADVIFTNDVEIAGTLKTADLTTAITAGGPDLRHGAAATTSDMGALYLEAQQVFVRSTGSIITRGLNGAAGQRGGDGGLVYIYAYNYFVNNGTIDNSGGNGADLSASSTTDGGHAGVSSGWGTYLEINVDDFFGPSSSGSGGGVFVNTGKLTTNGGNGATGGDTSQVYLYAYTDVFNKGPISSNAGIGTNGPGGNGFGYFYIYSYFGSIYNSGPLSQNGGNGATGGGTGGYIYLEAGYGGYSGDVVNSGSITADAGSATVSGTGGITQDIFLYAYGAVRTSGKISANGGDSMGANTGGRGGSLYIQNYVPKDFGFGEYMPVRPIQVSGNIYLNGGSSATGTGGRAGYFYVEQAASNAAARSDTGVQYLGYASANLSGGDGTSGGGGDAYAMYIYTYNDSVDVGYYTPAGPIQNMLAITMKGGKGTGAASYGGYGGYLDWESDGYYSAGGVSTLTNSGKIDLSGGNGGSGGGGFSNEIYWYGQDGVKNTGALVLRGGNSVGFTGGDGAYNGLYIYASGDIVNSGAIDTTGGSGLTGGNGSFWSGGTPFGNWVQIYAGGKVTNTGSITCVGGAGTVVNGNGGGIDILSERGATVNTGAMNVSPGSAPVNPGQKGQVWIDWVQVK